MAGLFNRLKKLAIPPEEARAQNLRTWCATVGDAVHISELQPRRRCRTAGVVHNVRIDPREGRGFVEATLIDGTGDLVVRWLGRPRLAGVRLGVGMIVEGMVAAGENGEFFILNPEYELIPGAEHG